MHCLIWSLSVRFLFFRNSVLASWRMYCFSLAVSSTRPDAACHCLASLKIRRYRPSTSCLVAAVILALTHTCSPKLSQQHVPGQPVWYDQDDEACCCCTGLGRRQRSFPYSRHPRDRLSDLTDHQDLEHPSSSTCRPWSDRRPRGDVIHFTLSPPWEDLAV